MIPGSGISTSGRSSDVADDGVVSTAFVICRSSGEFEAVAAATGAGIATNFGPPISGVALSGGAMLRITSESGSAFASISRSRTRCRISSASLHLLRPRRLGQKIRTGLLHRHVAMARTELVGLPPVAPLRVHVLDDAHVPLERRVARAFARRHRRELVDAVQLDEIARFRPEQLHVKMKHLARFTGGRGDGRAEERLRERGAEARTR